MATSPPNAGISLVPAAGPVGSPLPQSMPQQVAAPPVGTLMHFTHGDMGQLGMESPPKVGTAMRLHGTVHSIQSSAGPDGEPLHGFALDLTHAIEENQKSPAEKLYGETHK